MSDDTKDYGPNPELYERLAKPYGTKEEADHSVKGFLLAVKKLREEYGIPEVLVMAAAHFTPDEKTKETVTVRAVAFGSPEFRAQLGALAFNQYTLPEIERAEQLRNLATSPTERATRRKK